MSLGIGEHSLVELQSLGWIAILICHLSTLWMEMILVKTMLRERLFKYPIICRVL